MSLPMPEDVQLAKSQIQDWVRTWFNRLCAEHPQKRFHAVAFGFHDDFVGMSLNAMSLDTFEENDESEDAEDAPWNDTHWPHQTTFYEAWEAIPIEREEESFQHYRAKCLLATIEALRELGAEGLWGTGTEQVLVYLSMWDGFAYRWLWSESARRIQPQGLDPNHRIHQLARFNKPEIMWQDKDWFKFLRRCKEPLAKAFYELIGEPMVKT